jgi:hypothetical protein
MEVQVVPDAVHQRQDVRSVCHRDVVKGCRMMCASYSMRGQLVLASIYEVPAMWSDDPRCSVM